MSEREGTQGYAEQAPELVPRYERIPFEAAHRAVADLIPPPPRNVLDIGAGSGRDAAWFAARGDQVTAVEPTAEMRSRAIALHPSTNIAWVDDALPELGTVRGTFDLVWLSAVWMHLAADERERAMPVVAALVRPGGSLMVSLRHGPIPAGRRMFGVGADETIGLALRAAFTCVRNVQADSDIAQGVRWSSLWFRR